MFTFIKSYSFVCFDSTGDGAGDGTGDGAGDGAGDKTFTQEEVNTYLATETKKHKETQRRLSDNQKKLAAQLKEYQTTAKLGSDEKADLEKQIEDLQKQYMTKEEQTRHAAEKDAKKHTKLIEDLATERDLWKDRHTRATINVALVQAANNNKAVRAEQIVALLRPATKLVETMDEEGKPTGLHEARVDFQDLDKKDKPVTLDLTVEEAVKRMTELPQHHNLFEGSKAGGLGGSGSTGKTSKLDLADIAKNDVARYRKLRKEKPELFTDM